MDGRLRPFVDFFWTKIDNLIVSRSIGALSSTFTNQGTAVSTGGELGTEYDLYHWVTLIANYAFNHIQYDDALDINLSPKHKINGGIKLKFLDDKMKIKLLSHYVSGANSDLGLGGKVPAYVMGNLSVSYLLNDDLEVTFSRI